jgi:hypothetical protein
MREQRCASGGKGAVVVAQACLALALGACGYRPLDGRGFFGPEVRTIEVEAFDNESREPGLEQQVADALVEEFSRRAWLEPVLQGQVASPDLVMTGLLRSATCARTRTRPGPRARAARRVSFDVSVASGNPARCLSPPDFVTGGLSVERRSRVYASNKEQALRRVASVIAERVHDELFHRPSASDEAISLRSS